MVAAPPADEKGEVQLLGIPPGKYVVLADTPMRDYSVVRMSANGTQSSGHSLDLAAGATTEGTVSLVGGTGSVEGFAKRAGKGVAGVMVVLVPKDPEANGELFRRDQSDRWKLQPRQRGSRRRYDPGDRAPMGLGWVAARHQRSLPRSQAQDLSECGGPRAVRLFQAVVVQMR